MWKPSFPEGHKMTDPDYGILKPDDYIEPRCVLCGSVPGQDSAVMPVPQQRIIAKMDEYMSRRDYDGAEKHLLYWLAEARAGNDKGGELMIAGELAGHYRKTGNKEEAFKFAELSVKLVKELGMEGTVSAGTAYTNAATVYNAFGENEKSLTLFQKAGAAYQASDNVSPGLWGGLCNNTALVLKELGRFDEASAMFEKAVIWMADVEGGELEQAVTYLNMADMAAARYGAEQAEPLIYEYADKACSLLEDTKAPHDGYYAFVLEKCVPALRYYGYFSAADTFEKISEEIYGREAGNSEGT